MRLLTFLFDFLIIIGVMGLIIFLLEIMSILIIGIYEEIRDEVKREFMEYKPKNTRLRKDYKIPEPKSSLDAPLEVKDLNGKFTFTYMNPDIIKELQKFGRMYSYDSKNGFRYRLSLDSDSNTIISLVKIIGSYGFREDLWEIACLRNGKAKSILGYATDNEIVSYVKQINDFILDYKDEITSEDDKKVPTWFSDLPMEI